MDVEQFRALLRLVHQMGEQLGIPKERLGAMLDDVPSVPPMAERRPDGGMWRAKDLAGFLQVSVSWVYKHTEAGDIPHTRKHGVVRYDPEEIRAWLKDRGDGRAKVFPLRSRGG